MVILVLGQRFAQLEEKTILSTLLRRYTFRATQTIDELELCFEAIMRPEVPIKLIISFDFLGFSNISAD
ncbi:unnamed protein product [Rotaria magnacalcarata]|uniref:Uncharacterized protein n=1 Tax=Rotaria magnacalcarata TaxID=392030 RepID=A0A820FBY1_9BILA|nr:unnamed protein product [Rotaria magnacalcarata]